MSYFRDADLIFTPQYIKNNAFCDIVSYFVSFKLSSKMIRRKKY